MRKGVEMVPGEFNSKEKREKGVEGVVGVSTVKNLKPTQDL